MLRFIALLLSCLLIAAPALADLPLPEMATEDLIALRDAISLELAARSASADALAAWDTATAHVELLSVTRGVTDKGAPGADLVFSYTNTTDAVDNFREHHWVTVYHDGVETVRPIFLNDVLIASDAWSYKVLPGYTLKELHWYVELPGTEDTITVEVEDRSERPWHSAGMFTIQLPGK